MSRAIFDLVANPAFARHTGLHDAVGKIILQLVPTAETRIMDIYDDVVRTGEPRHFEACVSALDLWIEAESVPASGPNQIAVLFSNVSTRKRAEAALRESEERQKFLLELSDGLRTLSDPVDAMSMTAEMFGKQLGVAVAQFLLLDRDENSLTPCGVYSDGRAGPWARAGRTAIRHWPGLGPQFRAGESLFFDDHALRDGADAEASRGLRSGSAVPLVRDGRIVAIFSTADPEPRRWTEAEKRLHREVAERTWSAVERARADIARRASEARLRDFANASSDVLWMRDKSSLQWTYLSPVFERTYGISREDALSGDTWKNWLKVIVPEDREHAQRHLLRVSRGERVTFEYRIRRPDGQLRWIRNTDFPICDEAGNIVQIGGVGTDVTPIKVAEEHQRILLAELQHRVRNTLGIVRSIARRTAENSASVEDMLAHFQGRLDAFSRIQAVLTRSAGSAVNLASLIEDELVAHAAHDGGRVRINGPEVLLDPSTAERLSLAIHELVTNAVKHGALVNDRGRIQVDWSTQHDGSGQILLLQWSESGVELDLRQAGREGFGMELLERSLPYDLEAETEVDLRADGLRFALRMPLSWRPVFPPH